MSCRVPRPRPIVSPMMNTIAELVLSMPKSIPVLERLGIDYCCHGGQSIQQACSGASISAEELLAMIDDAPAAAPERSFTDETMPEIIDFILDTHHVYTRATLETLAPRAQKGAA